MILKNLSPWGFISGKLRIEPKTAKSVFGFQMKDGEQYIVFRVRNQKQIISHYPKLRVKPTILQLKRRKLFAILSKIAEDKIIKEIWQLLAYGNRLYYKNLFIKEKFNPVRKKAGKLLKFQWVILLLPRYYPLIIGRRGLSSFL